MMPANRRSVIPPTAWAVAGTVFVACFLLMNFIFLRRRYGPPFPVVVMAPVFVGLIFAAYVVAVGYVYGDARRRGMRHVMWTLLAIFVPNGIGIILYFILRDPMPVFCSRCGHPMHAGFAFCPGCGCTILPACQGCHKTLSPGWTHCAWCGRTV